jgi:hydrogenase expression/formation protein HypE
MSKSNNILSLSCPMPKMDFDIITLGHGSGGLLTNKLLDSGVFSIFKNDFLDQRHDGAIIQANGRIAISTDSFVVSPIFFPGGNIGDLAVNGTVNDLNMCGATALYLTLSFIIEEGLPMSDFWEILLTIKQAADEAGILIITGDTKVVERGKGDKIFINTTGIGHVPTKADITIKKIKVGDKIIISNSIANHGIAIMSVRNGLEFETTITSDTCHFNHIVPDLINKFESNIHLLKDPTRGGVATVLNEIARDANVGVEIFENKLVIEEEVAGACELLGLDPLYVANEGVFIAVVDSDMAEEILQSIIAFDSAYKASIIGEITEDHKKQVLLNSKIGGRRVVNMLLGEQLPRIC